MIGKIYFGVLRAMSALAGLMMVTMMISIVVDVILRNTGSQSSAHIFAFNEYFLFLIPLLGAPRLIREKGQIYVEALLMQWPPRVRAVLMKIILIACILTCAVLTWYAAEIAITDYMRHEVDVRSLDMPRWMLTGFMPVSFLFMGIEFLRFLVLGEDPYERADGKIVAH